MIGLLGRSDLSGAKRKRGKKTSNRRPGDSRNVGMSTILLIILILLLVGALPTWPHSSKWGYGPSGGLGLVLIILIVLVLMGRI